MTAKFFPLYYLNIFSHDENDFIILNYIFNVFEAIKTLILNTKKTIDKKSSHDPYKAVETATRLCPIFCIVFNWFSIK